MRAQLTLAGPFGHGTAPDRRRSFGAEKPGAVAALVARRPRAGSSPHVLKTDQQPLLSGSTEDVGEGVFYAQSFFTIERATATSSSPSRARSRSGSTTRSCSSASFGTWGVWQQFGAVVHVEAGRHRVLARLMADGSSVRLLKPDGRPADVHDRRRRRARLLAHPSARARRPEPDRRDRRRRAPAAGSARSPALRSMPAARTPRTSRGSTTSPTCSSIRSWSPRTPRPSRSRSARSSWRGDPALAADVRSATRRICARAPSRPTRGSGRHGAWLDPRRGEAGGPRRRGSSRSASSRPSSPTSRRSWRSRRSSTASSAGAPSGCAPLDDARGALPGRPRRAAALPRGARRGRLGRPRRTRSPRASRSSTPTARSPRPRARAARLEGRDRRAAAAREAAAGAQGHRGARRRRPGALRATRAPRPSELAKALAKNPHDATARFRLADAAYARGRH